MKISIDKGMTIPIRCYEIKAINKLSQCLIVEAAGGKTDKIVLLPNNNTLKCILDIKDVNYQIDFAVENSLQTVLGFDAKIYKHVSTLKNLIYIPITLNVISHMTCWLTDQNGNKLDLCVEACS